MSHPRFIIVDLETTSKEPAEAHVIEWAALVVTPNWYLQDGCLFHPDAVPTMHGGLVKPPIPIPPETSAVHHIIDADVAICSSWDFEGMRLRELFVLYPCSIAVAHNANYERTVLASLDLPCRWICTYKASVRVWPDAPSFSNEGLRYYLGLGTGRSGLQKPHTALHDAMVTAQLFSELLKLGTSIDDMLTWSDEPALLPRCPLGDWRGHPWDEVEESFLHWILRKITDREDVRFCAQKELERRDAERDELRKAQVA